MANATGVFGLFDMVSIKVLYLLALIHNPADFSALLNNDLDNIAALARMLKLVSRE